MVMKSIRVVINKNGSATAYIPAGLTDLFSQLTQAGHSDLIDSEPEKFDDIPNPLFEWEHR
tara:strand:+ start:434 stop:616 length:183 start_codon:yes stop_codon:yes gene_type:complete